MDLAMRLLRVGSLYHLHANSCYTKRVGVVDFIFPKYCVNCRKVGSYICPNCFVYISFDDSGICLECGKHAIEGITHPKCKKRFGIDGACASLAYKGVVKKLMYTFKYKPFVTDLQNILGDLLYEGIIQKESFHKAFSKDSLLVPIPLHSSKSRKRGYNQAEILAEELSIKTNVQVLNVLIRARNTKSQFGLTKLERRENMKDAFQLKNGVKERVQGKTVFLVDDILTTGSTLLEAAQVLKRNGVEGVWGITLARD